MRPFIICNGNNILDCVIAVSLTCFFLLFYHLTKKKADDISVVIAKIIGNAITYQRYRHYPVKRPNVLSSDNVIIKVAFTAAAFLAANEFGYFNRKNVSLPVNGRLSKNTYVVV